MKNVRCEMCGKKMKRILALFLILDLFMLTSCKECISQEQYSDLVVITDIEYASQIIQPYYINGNVYMQIYPGGFQTIVEYKGKKYVFSDYESYKLCENNKGEKIKAEINKKIYNDGSTKYSVIKLKGA